MEQIKDAIILEQFLNCLSSPIRVLIKESKPKSYLEAGQLADDYTEARKQVKERRSQSEGEAEFNIITRGGQSSGGSSKEKRSGYGQKFRRGK